MNCDNARELLAGYVLEALDADEREAVARHLARCADCSALARALAATAHELPLVLNALAAPELPSSILERLERERTARRRALRRLRFPARVRIPITAAAILVLAVLAVFAGVRSQQAVADEHALRARLVALVGQQSIVFDVVDSPHTTKALLLAERPGSRAYGKVYTRSDSHDAVAFVNRLPQPRGDNRYILWLRDGGATVRAGVVSLHGGFGYLVFRYRGPVRDAFVTLQKPAATAGGATVLRLARG